MSTDEHSIGHFDGAVKPPMKEFSAFPGFVNQHAEEWRGKQVLMYLLRGICIQNSN